MKVNWKMKSLKFWHGDNKICIQGVLNGSSPHSRLALRYSDIQSMSSEWSGVLNLLQLQGTLQTDSSPPQLYTAFFRSLLQCLKNTRGCLPTEILIIEFH
uniref:Uncharacterized protein n=1 Tax=Arundo donax TaxID=35708 RepID=A0A0A8Y3R4_ARUDO